MEAAELPLDLRDHTIRERVQYDADGLLAGIINARVNSQNINKEQNDDQVGNGRTDAALRPPGAREGA